jgi:hypothetical protein
MWVGKDLHMIIYTWKEGQDMAWVFTHKVRQPEAKGPLGRETCLRHSTV